MEPCLQGSLERLSAMTFIRGVALGRYYLAHTKVPDSQEESIIKTDLDANDWCLVLGGNKVFLEISVS